MDTNHPQINTTSHGHISFICGACGKTKPNATLYLDHIHGIVHCGCAHHPA